jgi:protein O-mannosyl-transferase
LISRQIKPPEKTSVGNSLCRLLVNSRFHVLMIAVLSLLCYSNTFHVPFVFDGLDQIRDNPVVHGLSNFFDNNSGYAFNKNRFVCFFTFALNYNLGGLNVSGYHQVNLAIHIVNALLVYVLLRLTFRTPFFREYAKLSKGSLLAFVVALLFVCHPLQTQAVTYIYQRLASLGTMFYLLSVVLYILARLRLGTPGTSGGSDAEGSQGGAKSGRVRTVLWFAGSLLFALLAMKTKEFSVTLPFMVILFEVSFFRGGWRRRLLYLLPVLLTIPIVPMSVFLQGFSGAPEVPGLSPAAATSDHLLSIVNEQFRVQTTIPRLDYFLTQFRVIVTYLRLLLLPVNQNLDYDYPVYSNFFTPPVLLSLLLLLALFALAVFFYWRSRPSCSRPLAVECRLIGFGILWFFMTLSVTSSVIPIADVIYEHRLYLPFVGAATAVAATCAWVFRRISMRVGFIIPALLTTLVICGFGVATYQRNQVWQSKITLWQDVAVKSPGKVRPFNNLGAALNEDGRFPEAISVLSRAIEIKPDHPEAWYNLGRTYILTGQYSKAIPLLEKAIRLKPDYVDAFINLAAALNRQRRFGETIALLENQLNRWGERAELRFNLGVAYAYTGNLPAAQTELAAVYRLDPALASQLSKLLR